MNLLQNPVARREWIWAERQWPLGLTLLIVAAAVNVFIRLFLLPWVYSRAVTFRAFVPVSLLFGWFRTSMFISLFVMVAALGRERRSRGWEELAVTRMTIREMIWGKLALPVGFVFLVSLVLFVITVVFLYFTLVSSSRGRAFTLGPMFATYPLGLVEDFLYALMACVIVFRFAWRRSFGHGILVSLGALLAVGLGLSILTSICTSLVTAVFSTSGIFQDLGWLYAIQNLAYNFPACVLEGWLTLRFFRRLEADMRSGLAGGMDSWLG